VFFYVAEFYNNCKLSPDRTVELPDPEDKGEEYVKQALSNEIASERAL